jgi:hypothetical protein
MTNFVPDGQPYEVPLSARVQAYANVAPTTEREMGALVNLNPVPEAGRYLERLTADRFVPDTAATRISRAMAGPQTNPAVTPVGPPALTPSPETPPEKWSASEINQWFAPEGTRITDQPMAPTLGAVLGKQKQNQIDRDSIIGRYQNAHSWPVNFGLGVATSLLDPVSVGAMFVPGIGGEAVASALGRIMGRTGARIAGRAVEGATSMTFGAAGVAGLQSALAGQEAEDYDLRRAFQQMGYMAAFGALVHAGVVGPITDRIARTRAGAMPATAEFAPPSPATAPSPEIDAAAADMLRQPAPVQHANLSTGIAQIVDGRPVDVMPVVAPREFALMSEEATLRGRSGEIQTTLGSLPEGSQEAGETLARVHQVDAQLAEAQAADPRLTDQSLPIEERRALSDQRDAMVENLRQRRAELLAGTTPEALGQAAAPLEQRRVLEAQQVSIEARLGEIAAERTRNAASAALSPLPRIGGAIALDPATLAEMQAALYRNGYAPAMSNVEFQAANEAVYGARKAPEGAAAHAEPTVPDAAKAAQWMSSQVAREEVAGEPHGPAVVLDPALVEAERQFAEAAPDLSDAERTELDASARAVTDAEQHQGAYAEAAACLTEAGL